MLDDRVVEACLSVRREERSTGAEWKPLMKAAMRDALPERFLRRSTKIGGSPQAVRGYQAHYGDTLEVCERRVRVRGLGTAVSVLP